MEALVVGDVVSGFVVTIQGNSVVWLDMEITKEITQPLDLS